MDKTDTRDYEMFSNFADVFYMACVNIGGFSPPRTAAHEAC